MTNEAPASQQQTHESRQSPSPEPSVVRPWEAALAALLVAAICLFMLPWALEGLIHNRATQVVPDLHGRSLSGALDLLSPIHLGVQKSGNEFNSSVPIASVIRQDPPGGTVVREGKIIKVVISQGGETVFTPSLVGLPLRNAEMLLRQNQLLLGEVAEAYSLKQEKGVVLSQDPKAETSIEKNALVNVSVSAGLPPSGALLMPDFLRKNISEAQAWASAHGIQIKQTRDSASPFAAGVVLTQDPAPDTVLSQTSSASFVVSGRISDSGAPGQGTKIFHYELSQGGSESMVRIVVVDQYGEREGFNGLRKPGSKIDLPLQESGSARIKIYLNGILIEERDF